SSSRIYEEVFETNQETTSKITTKCLECSKYTLLSHTGSGIVKPNHLFCRVCRGTPFHCHITLAMQSDMRHYHVPLPPTIRSNSIFQRFIWGLHCPFRNYLTHLFNR